VGASRRQVLPSGSPQASSPDSVHRRAQLPVLRLRERSGHQPGQPTRGRRAGAIPLTISACIVGQGPAIHNLQAAPNELVERSTAIASPAAGGRSPSAQAAFASLFHVITPCAWPLGDQTRRVRGGTLKKPTCLDKPSRDGSQAVVAGGRAGCCTAGTQAARKLGCPSHPNQSVHATVAGWRICAWRLPGGTQAGEP
jgi:hypothetical protein